MGRKRLELQEGEFAQENLREARGAEKRSFHQASPPETTNRIVRLRKMWPPRARSPWNGTWLASSQCGLETRKRLRQKKIRQNSLGPFRASSYDHIFAGNAIGALMKSLKRRTL